MIQNLHKHTLILSILVICLTGPELHSQEVCDNGLDDDGNGMIDLYDPVCVCEGITVIAPGVSHIPNPSFESMNWCPTSFAEMNAVVAWEPATMTTPDYLNTCNFVWPAIPEAGLIPFPDGNGVLGMIFVPSHMEYVGACLNMPFIAGNEYSLTLDIASVPLGFAGSTCNNGVITYGPVSFSIYGNPDCGSLDVPTAQCPLPVAPSWVLLGSASYAPSTEWSSITITFTPAANMHALMLGPPCPLPSDYTGSPCQPYILIDNLQLDEVQNFKDVDLHVFGTPCSPDFTLQADFPLSGGIWQWYFNGSALVGQQSSQFIVSENGHQPGMYAVTYTLNGECVSDSVEIEYVLPPPGVDTVIMCPGGIVTCAGEFFQSVGTYEVIIPSQGGCDSVVLCTILEYPSPGITEDTIELCGSAFALICEDTLVQSGSYTIPCTNVQGCDSLIYLTLNLLNPISIINPPPLLPCDTSLWITLDGSNSPYSLSGKTEFKWTGPLGGIMSSDTLSQISISLPGIYCLQITHVGLASSCTDSTCVLVKRESIHPSTPNLMTNGTICLGDTVKIHFNYDSSTILEWILEPDLPFKVESDSFLIIPTLDSGMLRIRSLAKTNCSISDTAEVWVSVFPGSQTFESFITCDSSKTGIDTVFLSNQYGCDSLVITEKLLGNHYEESKTITYCISGVNYTDTLIITGGNCDSLFITNYHYIKPDTTLLTATTCDATQAGTFTTVLQNQSGCDSTIITTIMLLSPDTVSVSGTTCDKSQAITAVITLTNQYGCDSVVTRTIIWEGADTTLITRTSCDTSQVGIHFHVLPMANAPCDSVIVETVTWSAQTQTTLAATLRCEENGPVADTTWHVATSGCDSLVISPYLYTHLTGLPETVDERCAGAADGQLMLTAISGSALPLEYRLNNGPWQSAPVFQDVSPGTYHLTVRDANGCTREWTGLTVQPGTSLTIDAGPDMEVAAGAIITVAVQSPFVLAQVQWSATDPLQCATCPTTTIGPITTTQMVTVQGWSALGCTETDQLQIRIREIERPGVYIPNSFSPNGDGINDVFTVYGNDHVRSIHLFAVYDRWGNELYRQSLLPINDPTAGWDGTFRGRLMDPGVYVYVVELKFSDGSIRMYKGDVLLVR